MKFLIAIASLSILVSACGEKDPVVGKWSGKTAGCVDDSFNGIDVVIDVNEERFVTLASGLGLSEPDADATVCSGGGVTLAEDSSRLTFESASTCDSGGGERQIERHLSLSASELDPDRQLGTIMVIVDGAVLDACSLTVTR